MNFFERIIAKHIFTKIHQEVVMTGWKTKLGGIALILTGAGMIATGVANGNFDVVTQGLALAGGGLTALGLGHKIDKNTQAVKDQPPRPTSLNG